MGTNNEHAAVSEVELVGGALRSLNQRNVLSEPLTAPTLVRGNRRADTRAHTPAPYFNHKLMFCLPRMHNCASRRWSPGFSCPRRGTGRPDVHLDDEDEALISLTMTRNEASNGFANTPCNPCVATLVATILQLPWTTSSKFWKNLNCLYLALFMWHF